MSIARGCALALLLCLHAPMLASAQAAPSLREVASVLCPRHGLDAATCSADDFAAPIAIDVDGDGGSEWIWVNTRGPRQDCFVRHACFSIVARSRTAWRVVADLSGSWVGFDGERRHAGHRDLIVGAGDSADAYTLTRFVWSARRRAYRPAQRAQCSHDPDAAQAAPRLCRAIVGEIPVQ